MVLVLCVCCHGACIVCVLPFNFLFYFVFLEKKIGHWKIWSLLVLKLSYGAHGGGRKEMIQVP